MQPWYRSSPGDEIGSYRQSCKYNGVSVSALRWLRYGDPEIMRRCQRARATGLLKRAASLRAKAAKLEREAELAYPNGVIGSYKIV